MTPALYLIDTSGLFRIFQEPYRKAWRDHIASGVIATCPIVELEFLYSARSLADRMEKLRIIRGLFGWTPVHDRAFDRAEEVQQLLTENGTHRSAGPVDLIIAAAAELQGLTVLSDDHDFESVSRITGQSVRMVSKI